MVSIADGFSISPFHLDPKKQQNSLDDMITSSTTLKYPITITARHFDITASIREHALSAMRRIHEEYPRIIDAKVVCIVEKDRHTAEIILHCAQHITLEAESTTHDLYSSIDLTVEKIERQMRKRIARKIKARRPKPRPVIDLGFFGEDALPDGDGIAAAV